MSEHFISEIPSAPFFNSDIPAFAADKIIIKCIGCRAANLIRNKQIGGWQAFLRKRHDYLGKRKARSVIYDSGRSVDIEEISAFVLLVAAPV